MKQRQFLKHRAVEECECDFQVWVECEEMATDSLIDVVPTLREARTLKEELEGKGRIASIMPKPKNAKCFEKEIVESVLSA